MPGLRITGGCHNRRRPPRLTSIRLARAVSPKPACRYDLSAMLGAGKEFGSARHTTRPKEMRTGCRHDLQAVVCEVAHSATRRSVAQVVHDRIRQGAFRQAITCVVEHLAEFLPDTPFHDRPGISPSLPRLPAGLFLAAPTAITDSIPNAASTRGTVPFTD